MTDTNQPRAGNFTAAAPRSMKLKAVGASQALDPDEEFRLATFVVGDDLYAIDIMRIKEIVRPLPITAVPKAPPGMVGVVDLRGSVFPMFDLRARFSLPARAASELPNVRQVIVTLDGRLLGLVVDHVHDVISVKRSMVRVGEGVLEGESANAFLGVVPVARAGTAERLALLLNLRRVLRGAHTFGVDALLTGTNPTIVPTTLPTAVDREGSS